jgi:hypothetical protein
VCVIGVRDDKDQHDLVHKIRFLTGLNDSFDMVRSQILLMDPLPPINKVFSMVIQYERKFVTSNSGMDLEDSKVSVNDSDSRRSQGRGKGGYNGQSNSGSKKRYCTYCGQDNHIVDNCYKKHGLPPHVRKSSSANNIMIEGSSSNDVVEPSNVTLRSSPITQDQAQ